MRFARDTGGTFTDLVVEDDDGGLHMFKAPTTPDDPARGILDTVRAAAKALSLSPAALLALTGLATASRGTGSDSARLGPSSRASS